MQSAVEYPGTSQLSRKLMEERGIGVAAGRGAVARRGHQIDVRPRPRPPRMHDEHDGYALG